MIVSLFSCSNLVSAANKSCSTFLVFCSAAFVLSLAVLIFDSVSLFSCSNLVLAANKSSSAFLVFC